MLAVSQLQSARHLLRCPWLWHARSLHRCLPGQAALLHPQAVCRVVIKGHAHPARGFRKRAVKLPSTLRSTDLLTDEGAYDAGHVDDWGVNRDMQEEYRAPLAKELDACKNAAASLLSYRPHARAELAGKLTDKGFDHETIEAALARLSELGLQSDREFAAVFARSKWRQSRWAPSRIRIDLVRKGVAKADIEGGLREVFGDDAAQQQFRSGVHSGEERVEGAPEDEQSFDRQLLAAAQRQAQLTKGLPMETRRRRLVAWLQRRGHGWGTVSALLRELTL